MPLAANDTDTDITAALAGGNEHFAPQMQQVNALTTATSV